MRADLQRFYGVRLREWLADRSRWGELLDLIDMLPTASRTKEALLNDPDTARLIAEADDGSAPEWTPPISEYTTEAAVFAAVFDRLGVLVDTVSGALGGKGRSQTFPRPVTEVDRIKERARREAAEELIALFGGRATP